MVKPHPLPRALGSMFSTRRAIEEGVSKNRLRASDLAHPFHAVHSSKPVRTLSDRCWAYLRRAGGDEYFSHVTAAKLWGLPLPDRLKAQDALDVSVSFPDHPPQAAGIRGHRIQRVVRPVVRGGLPMVKPVECWIELASMLNVNELVVVGDALVRRERPLAAISELTAAVSRAKGVRGIAKLRRAVSLVRPGTDSPMETELRLFIIDSGLPEPQVGYRVMDGATYVGTPDLAYVDHRIALEYEGDDHRTSKRRFRNDIERKERFHDVDWRTIRCTPEHLEPGSPLPGRIRRALAKPIDSGRSLQKRRS